MPKFWFFKLTSFLIILLLSQESRAQTSILEKHISVNIHKATMPDILKQISAQTGLVFSYSNEILPQGKLSLTVNNEQVNNVLLILLTKHKLTFSLLYGNVIVINKKPDKPKKLLTLSGYVYDDSTGEKVIGALIYDFFTLKGTTTNDDGFYSLTLEKDSVWLIAAYFGYKPVIQKFYLDWHKRLNFYFSGSIDSIEKLPDVNKPANYNNITPYALPDEFRIPMLRLRNIPLLFGESDIFKLLQLLPGVQAGNEGTTGLYVRGGGPDQNLILLDDVPVYNASHIYGFFSIFNSDIVKNARLIKGSGTARYGGRLSSVIDIRTIDGNTKKVKSELSLGILASKFAVDGPLNKSKKTTFMLSGRRTYFDLIGALFSNSSPVINGRKFSTNYYFYDINGKINHKFDDKNSLSVSFYNGSDRSYIYNSFSLKNPNNVIKEKDKQILYWGNTVISTRYSRLINKKVFAQVTGAFTNYQFGNKSSYEYEETGNSVNTSYKYLSEIRDFSLILDVDYKPAQFWEIKTGGNAVLHRFSPGISTYSFNSTVSNSAINKIIIAQEASAYMENDLKINRRLNCNIGARYTFFNVQEKFTQSLQPRFNMKYRLASHFNFNSSYSRSTQFIHLLTNATIGLPLDLWLPSTAKIKPEYSEQFTAGLSYSPTSWHFSIEGYSKKLYNVLEYKEHANYLNTTNDWEDKVEVGKGRAYGSEFLIEKKSGRTTGWLGYTLSWNFRQFDNINGGKMFPYRYDRRHDIGIFISHVFSKKTELITTWTYATGNSITLPSQRYIASSATNPFQDIYIYGERNNYKMPAYHRMDVVMNFTRNRKKYSRIWSVGIYNIYNRLNPFYISTGFSKDGSHTLQQVSIFPLFPSVSYKISF